MGDYGCVGQKIGDYVLADKVGQVAFGEVWRATHQEGVVVGAHAGTVPGWATPTLRYLVWPGGQVTVCDNGTWAAVVLGYDVIPCQVEAAGAGNSIFFEVLNWK